MIKNVIILCLLPLSVFATADGPTFYGVEGVAKGHHLTLREKPTFDATPITYIPHNTICLENLGCQGGISLKDFQTLSENELAKKIKENPRWCKIKYNSTIGWAFGKFLTEKPCP